MTVLLEAIRSRILASSDLTTAFGVQVRPGYAEEGDTPPYCVLQMVAGTEEEQLSGDAGIEHAQMQIDVYSATQINADVLSKQIKDQLVGYRGTIGTITITGIGRIGTARQIFDIKLDGVKGTSQDYLISHRY